jgi:hypothetical protein
MIIEDLDFNGSSDIMQYIPQVEPAQQPSPEQTQPPVQQQSSFGLPDELQPMYQTRSIEQPELFKAEIKPPQIEMDFSTPISDVVPSADFDMGQSMGGGGPYKNPQNNRVAALSLDNASAGPVSSSSSKNPFGLTDDQLNAALAGIAAVAAFSKPVQNKLADLIPKFMSDTGNLSATGMLATAFIAAVIFFIVHKFAKPPPKK